MGWSASKSTGGKIEKQRGAFKAAITQGMSKSLGVEYHLDCSWRHQSSEKVEKINDITKRHLNKLT